VRVMLCLGQTLKRRRGLCHKAAAWVHVRHSPLTPNPLPEGEGERCRSISHRHDRRYRPHHALHSGEPFSEGEADGSAAGEDRVRNKFNVAIAEVDENDVWQRGVLGLTLLGNDRRFVESALDEVVRFVRGLAEATNVERELLTFSQPLAENDLGWKG